MNEKRNNNCDAIKGFLILLVILGHTLRGGLEDNFFRGIIYSFHMPIFLFISGWLLKFDKAEHLVSVDTFKKYWSKMLVWWCCAWIVYSMPMIIVDFNWKTVVNNLIFPYFHLWYIPSLFFMIILSSFFREKLGLFLFLSFVVGVISMIVVSFLNDYHFRALYYLPYFALGVFCHHKTSRHWQLSSTWAIVISCILLSVSYFMIRGTGFFSYRTCVFFPICIFLCIFGIAPILQDYGGKETFIGYIGKHTLQIYLWHIMPLQLLWSLNLTTIKYYIMATTYIVIFLLIMYRAYKQKIRII